MTPRLRIRKNLKGEWKSTGDPTEVALQVFATKLGLGRPSLTSDSVGPTESPPRSALGEKIVDKEKIKFSDEEEETPKRKRYELKAEFPFSSDLKRMTTIFLDNESEKHALCLIKGAVRISLSVIAHRDL